MAKNESEIWKALPGVPGIEVSTFGNVKTLDRVVSSEDITRFTKGRILKQQDNAHGYMQVGILIDGKRNIKYVHRMVAKTFIPNPGGLPEINHKDNNSFNNNASNLEWCTHEYNIAYKEKYGTPAKESVKRLPVYVVNLMTGETLWFASQNEASKVIGIKQGSISSVIRGKTKQTCGYWFVTADKNSADAIKHKLEEVGF